MDTSFTITNIAAQATKNEPVNLAYGATLTDDAASFRASLEAAAEKNGVSGSDLARSDSISELAKAAFEPLDFINQEANSLSEYAKNAVESGNQLTPAEIVNLTVQSHKFMFHSQLTANVANRSADGIQQLFRQQG